MLGHSALSPADLEEKFGLLGGDIFVAPVLNKEGTVNISFPAGNDWVYLYDKSRVYDGGATLSDTWPIDEFPVFVRQGSAWVDNLNP